MILKGSIILIKEVIVVEGRDDIAAVKKAVDAEMIAVGGFGINAKVIAVSYTHLTLPTNSRV